jgi:hypothetical protein
VKRLDTLTVAQLRARLQGTMSEYIGGSPDSILERLQRDSERRAELEHQRQVALIRLQSHALTWTGTQEELVTTVTKWYEAGWLVSPTLHDALQLAAYHFLRPDGSAVILPQGATAPPRSSKRFKPLEVGCRVIEFNGRQYSLTSIQASVVSCLLKAHQEKRSSVAVEEIYKSMQVNSGKMSQWFRGKNESLYGQLIVQTSSRKHYRLDI